MGHISLVSVSLSNERRNFLLKQKQEKSVILMLFTELINYVYYCVRFSLQFLKFIPSFIPAHAISYINTWWKEKYKNITNTVFCLKYKYKYYSCFKYINKYFCPFK